jgi:hypothetical protein
LGGFSILNRRYNLLYSLGSFFFLIGQFPTTTMAPVQSKLTQPEISGQRKRKVSSRITDENFVGAESNAVTKRLKLSANAGLAQTASAKRQQRQASVEDVEDESDIPMNNPPKNPNVLLETADGSEDDVEMLEDDPPPLEDTEPYGEDDDDDDDEPEIVEKPIETAEAQRGKSNKAVQNLCSPCSIRTAVQGVGVSNLCVLPANSSYRDC